MERTLAQGQPSDGALVQVQQLMEEELQENLFLNGARGERAMGDEIMEDLQSAPLRARQLTAMGGGPGVSLMTMDGISMLIPGALKTNRSALLRLNNRVVKIAKKPVEAQLDDLKDIDASAAQLPVIARMIAAAIVKVARASLRDVAQMRCAIVMVAAERYRRAEGHWPAAIADLLPKYLPDVPLDPFDGQPLRMRRFEEGLVIYSVGENRKDDGGSVDFAPGSGFLDYGYRLWDVEKRRQAPLKK